CVQPERVGPKANFVTCKKNVVELPDRMSALGHKQTFAMQKAMSALPPLATSIAFFGISALGRGERGPTNTGALYGAAMSPCAGCTFGLNEPLRLNRLRRHLRHWGVAILGGRICRNSAWA